MTRAHRRQEKFGRQKFPAHKAGSIPAPADGVPLDVESFSVVDGVFQDTWFPVGMERLFVGLARETQRKKEQQQDLLSVLLQRAAQMEAQAQQVAGWQEEGEEGLF